MIQDHANHDSASSIPPPFLSSLYTNTVPFPPSYFPGTLPTYPHLLPIRLQELHPALIGEGLGSEERPLHLLAQRAKVVARAAKVKFSAFVIVVEDAQAPASLTELRSIRGAQGLLVQRSRLVNLIRTGLPGVGVGGTDLFEVRTRLQQTVRFV